MRTSKYSEISLDSVYDKFHTYMILTTLKGIRDNPALSNPTMTDFRGTGTRAFWELYMNRAISAVLLRLVYRRSFN